MHLSLAVVNKTPCNCTECQKMRDSESPTSIVVDYRPSARTILLAENAERPATSLFLRLPFLRFVIGFNRDECMTWNRMLYMVGSVHPFGPTDVGFAIPLPNFNRGGQLTCPGNMPIHMANSHRELATRTITSFWQSQFLAVLDQPFPLTDNRLIKSFRQFQALGLEGYRLLPPNQSLEISRCEPVEEPPTILVPAP